MMADGQQLKKPPGYVNPAAHSPQSKPVGPRKPAIPPGYYQPKKKSNCCRICCCCVCCVLFFLIMIFIIFCALFYAFFQPKIPVFHFRPMEIGKFSITPKKDGSALLDSNAVIRVEARNPNSKLNIYYDETEVILNLDEEIALGKATIPAFFQPSNNVTVLKFVLVVDNEEIDANSGARLNARVKNQDTEVNVEVNTKVGIGIGKAKLGMLPVKVNCGGVTLNQLDQGNVTPKCSFNTLKWITIH